MKKEDLKILVENTKNRDTMAVEYLSLAQLDCLKDWSYLNKLIIKRWSISGLKYIKRLAWGKQYE